MTLMTPARKNITVSTGRGVSTNLLGGRRRPVGNGKTYLK